MINEEIRKLNQCVCCNDIWNFCNLNKIVIGSHDLYFCSDCYKDFCDKYKEIENEDN